MRSGSSLLYDTVKQTSPGVHFLSSVLL